MSRLIKKYKNRRLYDTELSQYITIEDLHRYVLDKIAFHVEDSSTGKDLTSVTLLQILVEQETGPTEFLSDEILRQLILLASHPMSQPVKKMFAEMMGYMETQMQTNPYLRDYQKALEAWNEQMQHLFKQW